MRDTFEELECEDEVLSVENADKIFIEYPMFTVGQLLSKIKYLLRQYGCSNDQKMASWFGKGTNCEFLRFGAKGWQKGKVRIRLTIEFCPDEPEITQPDSPLDDLRQMRNQETQQ